MPFIHSYLIIVIFIPFLIHPSDQNVDHHKDLYFEVLEPCMSFHFYIYFQLDLNLFFFLADISYTFRCRPAKGFGTKFVS
jgi:hypothetical protein